MSTKLALIISIMAIALFGLYIWQYGAPEQGPTDEPPQQEPMVELREPDSLTPAASVCAFQEGALVTFEIIEGIPNPRCARVLSGQRLAFANGTSADLSFTFSNYELVIPQGSTGVIDASVESYLRPGVHVVAMDLYNGSGPEVWVQDTSVVKFDGRVTQTFVSARAVVIEREDGTEVSIAVDEETRIFDAEGSSVSPNTFSLALPPNTQVSAIADMEDGTSGLALELRAVES